MKYAEIEWNNGTPRSRRYDDVYFSQDDGLDETAYVFLQQNELPERWQQQADRFVIAETGFGTGLNFLLTMKAWLETAPAGAVLHYISIEKFPVSPEDIARIASRWRELDPCVEELLRVYPPPLPGMHLVELAGGRVRLHLVFDEVESALAQISCRVDAWYLDGFAPSSNPDMWTERVFELIGRNTRVGGSFATYTAAGTVRRGLADAGFEVQKCKGYGRKRDMLKGFMVEQRCYTVEKPWFSVPVVRCEQKRAAIIGAGLSGLAMALALCKRGWHVTVIDRHAAVAQEASGNPAGLLMPRLTRDETLDARFYINAFIYAIQYLDRLQAESKDRFWFKTGNVLTGSAAKLKALSESHRYPEAFIRYLDNDEAREFAGADLDHDALLFVDAGWVDVRRLCDRLADACKSSLEIRQADVSDVRIRNGLWQLTGPDSETLATSDCVVVANGDSANRFSALEWLPVNAVRGQLTLAAQTQTSRNIRCGISADRYITPAFEGVHVIGASYDAENASTELSVVDQLENISGINRLIPGCVDPTSELAGRVAFRAVSKDRVPVVGCVPDEAAFKQQYAGLHHGRRSKLYPPGIYLPGLYVSAAHGSRGLCSCFISAEIIAAMIAAEPAPVEKDLLDFLNPARFIIRTLKRNRA